MGCAESRVAQRAAIRLAQLLNWRRSVHIDPCVSTTYARRSCARARDARCLRLIQIIQTCCEVMVAKAAIAPSFLPRLERN